MKEKDYKQVLGEYRLERAKTTLDDAQNLYNLQGSPVSIVNRAYYSMFYAALALLATVNKESRKHSGVLALFDQMFIKTNKLPKEMSKMLREAFNTRQAGDYEDNAHVDIAKATQILE